MDGTLEEAGNAERSSSLAENVSMTFRGFEQVAAESYASTLGGLIHEIGKFIDLSMLDGMTIAFDYDDALADLDRGYDTIRTLTRTTEFATGVAMTPAVLREGVLKSHVVISGAIALMLESEDRGDVRLAIHTIAHECAHVEVTAAYDGCFPNEVLRKHHETVMESWRWDVIKACWEEYAACRIASDFGYDPLPGYEETFVLAHSRTDEKIIQMVDFDGGNADPLVGSVFGAYGTMMKFSCYMLGAMAAGGKTMADCPADQSALNGHWFAPYFSRLKEACEDLYERFGNWPDKVGFEEIGDIVEAIVTDRIMRIWHHSDGTYTIYIYPDIPVGAKA